jgi:hypothetical protein
MKRGSTYCVQATSKLIICHRHARANRLVIEGRKRFFGYVLLRPFHFLLRKREMRYLDLLLVSDPPCPAEARNKLLYLMALMAANAIDPPAPQIKAAIGTLRPFKADLRATLGENQSAVVRSMTKLPQGKTEALPQRFRAGQVDWSRSLGSAQ